MFFNVLIYVVVHNAYPWKKWQFYKAFLCIKIFCRPYILNTYLLCYILIKWFRTYLHKSVGSNPNPGFSNKTKIQTLSNPSKQSKHQTCSARNGPNPGPNPEKPIFKSFWTQVSLPKMDYEPTQTLQKSRTSNPKKWVRSNATT